VGKFIEFIDKKEKSFVLHLVYKHFSCVFFVEKLRNNVEKKNQLFCD
jgi:hypothetical protein